MLVTCAYLVDASSPWVLQSLFLAAIGEARDRGAAQIEAFSYRYPEGESAYERFRVHKTVFPSDFLGDFGFRTVRSAGRVGLARLELGGLQPVLEGRREKVLRAAEGGVRPGAGARPRGRSRSAGARARPRRATPRSASTTRRASRWLSLRYFSRCGSVAAVSSATSRRARRSARSSRIVSRLSRTGASPTRSAASSRRIGSETSCGCCGRVCHPLAQRVEPLLRQLVVRPRVRAAGRLAGAEVAEQLEPLRLGVVLALGRGLVDAALPHHPHEVVRPGAAAADEHEHGVRGGRECAS